MQRTAVMRQRVDRRFEQFPCCLRIPDLWFLSVMVIRCLIIVIRLWMDLSLIIFCISPRWVLQGLKWLAWGNRVQDVGSVFNRVENG